MTNLETLMNQRADSADSLAQAQHAYSIAVLNMEAAKISLRSARQRHNYLLDRIRLTSTLKGDLS